jgi:hypothetical protein
MSYMWLLLCRDEQVGRLGAGATLDAQRALAMARCREPKPETAVKGPGTNPAGGPVAGALSHKQEMRVGQDEACTDRGSDMVDDFLRVEKRRQGGSEIVSGDHAPFWRLATQRRQEGEPCMSPPSDCRLPGPELTPRSSASELQDKRVEPLLFRNSGLVLRRSLIEESALYRRIP